jgi:hypothetical protein
MELSMGWQFTVCCCQCNESPRGLITAPSHSMKLWNTAPENSAFQHPGNISHHNLKKSETHTAVHLLWITEFHQTRICTTTLKVTYAYPDCVTEFVMKVQVGLVCRQTTLEKLLYIKWVKWFTNISGVQRENPITPCTSHTISSKRRFLLASMLLYELVVTKLKTNLSLSVCNKYLSQ